MNRALQSSFTHYALRTTSRLIHRCLAILILCLAVSTVPAATTNSLVWHKNDNRIDADIESWNLEQLLENVAAKTGWKVYLDPRASHKVSAKFTDLSFGAALHMLLGDVNFVVVPQTNGTSRLYVFRSSQNQATKLIRATKSNSAKPIPKQLVVIMKPGSKGKIDELARALGAKVIGRMDKQNAYLLEFSDDAATQSARSQLATNPDVAAVDSNFPVDRPVTVDASDSANAELQLKPKPDDGTCPLIVGLIDTAIQPLNSSLSSFILPPLSVVGNYTAPTTQLTHATAMAQTILQPVAQKTKGSTSVKIQPVDIYGANETTSTFNVAAGIVAAVNSGADIINLSLGSSGDSTLLHNTIIQVSQQGIPIYAAAGNEPVTTPTYPAAYPEVVSVTASDNTGKIADYANRGSFIDMMAPGDNVVGFNGQSYLVEGTSTATAFASGMAAGLADANHACATQAETLLKQSLKPASILK